MMMQLGSFQFGLSTAAYQEFQRSTGWTWAAQGRFGKDDSLQATGIGPDTITLPGVIFPEFAGGLGQIEAMRDLAQQQEFQTLVDGRGRVLGDWAIEQIEERSAVFIASGVPLRMEFTIKLRRGPLETGLGLIQSVVGELTQGFPAAAGIITNAGSVAASATNGGTTMSGMLSNSLATVSSFAGALGTQSSIILGTVRSGMNAANVLASAGGDAARLLQGIKSPAGIASAMNGLVNIGGGVSRSAGLAGSILKSAGVDLAATNANPAAIAAVRASMIGINQLNVLAVSVRTKANDLLGKI
jgi:phage protein U